MKARDLAELLVKVDPETEVLCYGDGDNLYKDITIWDRSCIGELWMIGVDKSQFVQELEIQYELEDQP
jgi:hypothetical protein